MPAPSRSHGPFVMYPGAYFPQPSTVSGSHYSPLMKMFNTGKSTRPVGAGKIPQFPVCFICMNGIADLMILPCQHHFHRICLERMLLYHMSQRKSASGQQGTPDCAVCPVCNTQIKQQQPLGIPIPTPPAQGSRSKQAAYTAMMNCQPRKLSKEEHSAREALFQAELRRGKWTKEEEAYVQALIEEFRLGVLPLKDGCRCDMAV